MRTDAGPAHAAPSLPVSDRWAFKPVALLLLLAVLVATAGVTALVISPPFLAAGLGVKEVQSRLDAAGADFTRIPRLPQRSTIYASDGKTVLAHIYLDNREIVPLRRISPNAIKAVLAIEDDSFYEHGALNLTATLRALFANIKAGSVQQGGSTITQQLVKNTLGSDDVSLARKFQELALAQRVEQHYSKDKILELYLNQVFLGNNVYGVGTAARFYFHKSAADLTLPEAAMLAGLNKGPSEYNPITHPHAALLRRNDVLNRMIALGPDDGGVSAARGQRAKDSLLGLAPNVGGTGLPTPPFLVDYVKQQIVDDPNGWYSVLGATPEQRQRELSEGGLDIVTTLDPDVAEGRAEGRERPVGKHARRTRATRRNRTSRSCRSARTPGRSARCSAVAITRRTRSTRSRPSTRRGPRSSPTCSRPPSRRASRRRRPTPASRGRSPGAPTATAPSGT